MAANQAARAQTAQTLDQVARALKRQIRESRELLGLVRRAEVTLLGIEVQDVQNNAQLPEGGQQSGHSPDADPAGP